MKLTVKDTKKIKLFSVLFFIICFLFVSAPAKADGDIAVTGSFATYEYHILQAQGLDSPLVNLLFINNNSHSVKAKITSIVPQGVYIAVPDEVITIDAKSKTILPVTIKTDETCATGEHTIGITAEITNDSSGAASSNATYSLKTKLYIVNQSARVYLSVLDTFGEPIQSEIYLYKVTDDKKSPAAYSNDTSIHAKVVPGIYQAICIINNQIVAEDKFEVLSGQEYTNILNTETTKIENFTVTPVFAQSSKVRLESVNIDFILNNIYQELSDAIVSLQVYENENLVEEKDIFTFNTVDVRSQELNYNYSLSTKWEKEKYKFVLQLKTQNPSVIHAQSNPIVLDNASFYPAKRNVWPQILLAILILSILAGLYFVTVYLFQKVDIPIDEKDDEDEKEDAESTVYQIKEITADAEQKDEDITDNKPESEEPEAEDNLTDDNHDLCPICNDEGTFACPVCDGKGTTLYQSVKEECIYCSGLGKVMCPSCVDRRTLMTCLKCNGNGYLEKDGKKHDCTNCNGLGYIVARKFAIFENGVKVKLGDKNKKNRR